MALTLNSSEFISTLIDSGPDLPLNLYKVEFVFNNIQEAPSTSSSDSVSDSSVPVKMSYRTTTFSPPGMEIKTANIPYMNISVPIVVPGVNIQRTLDLQMRLDANYDILSFLRSVSCSNEDGDFNKTDKSLCDINVTAYSYTSASTNDYSLTGIYEWNFYDCRCINIPSLSYSYNGGEGIMNLRFIFNRYEEGKI